MRTVKLIQFTTDDVNYGDTPDLFRWYVIHDEDAEYEYESDDDTETFEAFKLRDRILAYRDGSKRQVYIKVVKEDVEYNIITIELEETSELFR